MRQTISAEERRLGYESPVIRSRYTGGRCALCKGPIVKDGGWTRCDIVRFRGRGWCHSGCTVKVVCLEQDVQNARRPHDDPMVAAAWARLLPEVEAKLAHLLSLEVR